MLTNALLLLSFDDRSDIWINLTELAELHKTGYTPITFDQLYGGGQGVYGANEHDGVTVHEIDPNNAKTFYIEGWPELRLRYRYCNGEDKWTTSVDGLLIANAVKETVNGTIVYKVFLPAYVAGFSITFDGKTTHDIEFSVIAENQTYFVEEDETGIDHIHLFLDDVCGCGKEYNGFGEIPLG